MKSRLILLFPACAAAAFGQYAYDYTMNPVASDPSHWASNGSVTFGSSGVTFASQGR
jgi:hypothetical protein